MIKLNIDSLVMIEYNFLESMFRQNLYDVWTIMVSITTHKESTMTENEKKLLDLIHNHPHPEEAFLTALDIILMFVKNEAVEGYKSS